MKTYKNLAAFEKRVQKTTDWADYFKLGGRMYHIYEYGDTYTTSPHCYVYFINRRTSDMINVEYTLPTINYTDGKRVENGEYRLLNLYFLPNNPQWR